MPPDWMIYLLLTVIDENLNTCNDMQNTFITVKCVVMFCIQAMDTVMYK